MAKKIGVYYHEDFLKHFMGKHHMEQPRRVEVLVEALKKSEFQLEWLSPDPITFEELAKVHSPELIEFVEHATNEAPVWITPDTRTNEHTFSAAMRAAGAAREAALRAWDKKQLTIALTRPPGHHATANAAMGFCFFNNAAIAAQTLIEEEGLERIFIYDIDNHYGNGTASIFERSPKVLYSSIHCDPNECYPGIGYPEEVGTGAGVGHTVNVPVPVESDDIDWIAGITSIILPIAEQYDPQMVIISAGFDGLKGDPYGRLALSRDAFEMAGQALRDVLSRKARSRIVVLLEGGYKLPDIGNGLISLLRGLTDRGRPVPSSLPVSRLAERYFSKAKAIMRRYWEI